MPTGKDMANRDELGELLERLHDKYNTADFIPNDPISIPHRFSAQEDIEISGFLAATIAWGNRKAIVKSAGRMMEYMDDTPYDFVMNASDTELDKVTTYVHRTFNGEDFRSFIIALRRMYEAHGTLGGFFERAFAETGDMMDVLSLFRREFLLAEHNPHCEKHISSIDRKASCKRLNMYIRWMVREDGRGVDFGLWRTIPTSALYLPLDLHTGNMGRALGLLKRKQNDWRAVEEITLALRTFDPFDPVRFDYSLFGAGIDGFLK